MCQNFVFFGFSGEDVQFLGEKNAKICANFYYQVFQDQLFTL